MTAVSHPLLTDVRVILYDLDGTVYNDTAQFDTYAQSVQRRLPTSQQAEFWTHYLRAAAGQDDRVYVGRFYYAPKDLLLSVDRDGRAVQAYKGREALDHCHLADVPEYPAHDGYDMLNVGDLWGILGCLGRQYGLTREELRACFTETRMHMASDAFTFKPIPGLVETMQELRGKVGQVLGTNSPEDASRVILTKTRMLELMDGVYYSCNKPFGLPDLVKRIQQDWNVAPHQILSVGDNLPNEIAPGRHLGIRTAFIDPHQIGGPEDADVYVTNMVELVPILRDIGNSIRS